MEKAAPGPPTLLELADANFVAEAVARELRRLTTPPSSSHDTAAPSVLDALARERYGGPSGAAAEARLVTLHSELDKAVYHLAHSMQLRCAPPRLIRQSAAFSPELACGRAIRDSDGVWSSFS